MARMGSFSGSGRLYGQPLSIVHPPDNNVDAARFAPGLLDSSLKLSRAQREELQDRIDQLYKVMQGERDYF